MKKSSKNSTASPTQSRRASFEERFAQLKEFKKQYGHCNVPKYYPANPQLGLWIGTMRISYKRKKIDSERKDRLEKLGIVWDTHEAFLESRFQELKEFKKQHGHCNVPANYLPNLLLGKWISMMRISQKKGKLNSEVKSRLDVLGMVWNAQKAARETRFQELKEFKKKHGHCNVPTVYPSNPQLGNWIKTLRTAYKNGRIDTELKNQLDMLGMIWIKKK